MAKAKSPWVGKVINHAQIGGIETSVLDNGLGKGVRIAWINTGTGLRYKVVIDRALDIADAFFNQHSLVWLSHAGVTNPTPSCKRLEWLDFFGGGLLATCGLTHVGGPDEEHGLHGRVSNVPAQLESIVLPDPAAGKLDMSITAVTKQSSVFGPKLELRRTISSKLGEANIRIKDVITNRGNTATPHMMLYHLNFGWPLVDAGTELLYRGKCVSAGRPMDDAIFNDKNNYHKVPGPIKSHSGFGEACGFIDMESDKKGVCTAGIYNSKLALAVAIKFKKRQLPWLTNWQHWGAGEYVTGMEPGTNPPIGQKGAKEQNQLISLKTGAKRSYELELAVLTEDRDIKALLRSAR